MAALTYLDTHVVAWLFAGRLDLLSDRARDHLEANDLNVSPMVLLELDYLLEVGRIRSGGQEVFQSLQGSIGLRICDLPFDQVIGSASRQTWTRDPFDRIITGHAAVTGSHLVTRDEVVHGSYRGALW